MCQTPISVIAKAFNSKEPLQLRLAANMFPESQIQSEFLNEFYILDVILNRERKLRVSNKKLIAQLLRGPPSSAHKDIIGTSLNTSSHLQQSNSPHPQVEFFRILEMRFPPLVLH
jgi:hypothetical protein